MNSLTKLAGTKLAGTKLAGTKLARMKLAGTKLAGMKLAGMKLAGATILYFFTVLCFLCLFGLSENFLIELFLACESPTVTSVSRHVRLEHLVNGE